MPTPRTVTVQPSGGDYTTLAAALTGEAGDLVSLDRVLTISCATFVEQTGAGGGVLATGWTTDSTRNVTINAVDTHHGVIGGAYTLYYVGDPSGTVLNLQPSAAYFVIRGISIIGGGGADCVVTLAPNVTFDRVICYSAGPNATGPSINAGGCILVNCATYGNPGETSYGFIIQADASTTRLYNCTSYGCDTGFAAGLVATPASTFVIAINCLAARVGASPFGGFTTSTFLGGPSWAGSSNCASEDTTSPTSGTGHRTSQTFSFVDPTHGDMRLTSADTGAQGFGTSLAADATYPFAIDFTGAARATWDIGASNAAYTGATTPTGRFQRRAAFGLFGVM
jgi:hypothetical protein